MTWPMKGIAADICGGSGKLCFIPNRKVSRRHILLMASGMENSFRTGRVIHGCNEAGETAFLLTVRFEPMKSNLNPR